MSSLRIEAEMMSLVTYRLESKSVASEGQYISLRGGDRGETGTASFAFDGLTGTYDVVLGYFDETDGVSQLEVSKGGALIDAWDSNQNLGSAGVRTQTLAQRTVATGLSINNGDTFTIQGTEDGGEPARIDYIEFIPLVNTPPSASLSASDITSGGAKTYTFTATYTDDTAIDVSSLDSRDLKVSGPKGFDQLATLIDVEQGDGTPRQATYQITAPGGNWNEADNGTYTVSVAAEQVSDINNNFLSAGSLGTFGVNIVEEGPIRIEAETMALVTYRLESKSVASQGQYISLRGGDRRETGTASFAFNGPTGHYDVILEYFDETDGISQLKVSQEGALIDAWDWNQNLGSAGVRAQTLTQRTVATKLFIEAGDTFTIQGTEDGGEPTRVDYIEFIPIESGNGNEPPTIINGTKAAETLIGDARDNVINGFGGNDTLRGKQGNDLLAGGLGNDTLDGGDGTDTADYTQADNGIIANLSTGVVLVPVYGASALPKIMPIGDSITRGLHSVDPTPGAYRIQLWNDFVADGLSVDFVGSLSDGPDSLGDRDHEGHGGWTINRITSELVNSGLVKSYKPELVLLMGGTNDARNDTISVMYADLDNLIERIVDELPAAQLFVSSIAPVDPSGSKFSSLSQGQIRADKVKDFNALIPDLVGDKAAQGKKVSFANVGGSITLDDLVSDGIHPNAQGYSKMGDAWYSALVERDTLESIENIVGTAFNDRLEGNNQDNLLTGGAGSDTLTGSAGADTFVYKSKDEGSDLITDFRVDDRFRISASGFGGGLDAGVSLSTTASPTGAFVSSKNPTPTGTSANFLYNSNTGLLNFDGDGVGQAKALPIATLAGSPSLEAKHFTIVA